HSAQPIGQNKVLLYLNGTPAKAMLINVTNSDVEMEHVLNTKSPNEPKSVHMQFRHIRMTKKGTYLVPHFDMDKVVEYDKNWNEIWSVDAETPWAAVRLKNGNTLISGDRNGYVREVNPNKEVVWELENDELPGIPIHAVQEADRLANGNTL